MTVHRDRGVEPHTLLAVPLAALGSLGGQCPLGQGGGQGRRDCSKDRATSHRAEREADKEQMPCTHTTAMCFSFYIITKSQLPGFRAQYSVSAIMTKTIESH